MVLPRSMRLKGYKCFNYLYKEGKRYHGSLMLLRVVKANPKLKKHIEPGSVIETCKCAVAISNKVNKRAVVRNQLRRSIHEHLRIRLAYSGYQKDMWALLSLNPQSSTKSPCCQN